MTWYAWHIVTRQAILFAWCVHLHVSSKRLSPQHSLCNTCDIFLADTRHNQGMIPALLDFSWLLWLHTRPFWSQATSIWRYKCNSQNTGEARPHIVMLTAMEHTKMCMLQKRTMQIHSRVFGFIVTHAVLETCNPDFTRHAISLQVVLLLLLAPLNVWIGVGSTKYLHFGQPPWQLCNVMLTVQLACASLKVVTFHKCPLVEQGTQQTASKLLGVHLEGMTSSEEIIVWGVQQVPFNSLLLVRVQTSKCHSGVYITVRLWAHIKLTVYQWLLLFCRIQHSIIYWEHQRRLWFNCELGTLAWISLGH